MFQQREISRKEGFFMGFPVKNVPVKRDFQQREISRKERFFMRFPVKKVPVKNVPVKKAPCLKYHNMYFF